MGLNVYYCASYIIYKPFLIKIQFTNSQTTLPNGSTFYYTKYGRKIWRYFFITEKHYES